jgi:Cyclic nucleotide-binding domain
MDSQASDKDYYIWGIDDSPYGPVPLSVLIDWISDERVLPETWIFTRSGDVWQKAVDFSELKAYFQGGTDPISLTQTSARFKPGSLRRIKILAEMKDAQLAHLADFLEYQEIMQHTVVVRETILTTFGPGDIFGEMSLFDQGPRSADVVANMDSTVLRLANAAFDRLTREMPSLATPFLRATSRTLSARIRADNKRLARVTQQFSASAELQ